MNNVAIIIKFKGRIVDFDGYEQECSWDIPTNFQELVKDLIIKFYQISGLNEQQYITALHINQQKWSLNLFQAGLSNNSEIQIIKNDGKVSERVPEKLEIKNNTVDNNFKIFVKFIKSNTISHYRINAELKGLLKLCLLNEISLKLNQNDLEKIRYFSQEAYLILKILKQSNNTDLSKQDETIKKVLSEKVGSNILCFSNYVDEVLNSHTINQLMKYLNQNYLNQILDTKIRLAKYYYFVDMFEKEIQNSLRKSVFEFSVTSLVIIERNDFDIFEKERNSCPNRQERLLYHGTQIHPISCILTGMFRRSVESCQHGRGVYFTDDLDYCWFYGGDQDNRANKNIIPGIGKIFTAIATLVYYDKTKFLQVKDYYTREQPRKNEINFAYAGSDFDTIINPNPREFYGTEYVIWELSQICPLISLKFKRVEYCIIWRDINFSKDAIYGDQFDSLFKGFLKESIKYIRQEAKFNVYPCQTTEEALSLVNRKKYNKIILISNVGVDLGGKAFVDQARKIIGNDVVVLFLAYNIQHLEWIKNYKNALFSNDQKLYKEYLNSFNQPDPSLSINQLIKKCEFYYKVKFNFDNNYLYYPLYRDSGSYSDLTF
jgi:hypothetical protein